MDFLDRVIDAMEADLTLFDIVRIGNLDPDNSIAIRQFPTSPGTRFFDNSRDDTFGIQVLVKHANGTTARNTIQSITDYLESLTGVTSDDGSFLLVNIECSTLPNWVEETDRNQQIYTALFEATIYREAT
ncbi:hypothetical protein FLK61_34105 [Paenalkalicoccus suaedae]|uniref:Minor capsid protein n=1 Tax=Paenalkalicoccus suaedae TaxID=2592382 RepID=A0A859FFA3_9BACI|nr:minor capsid protein [Paenalkalicoccus suaedae]QKS71661.1 hypothetical protein FLK61_33810 [Paenalkalicoccus suaedae]QKS71715.1 hypothetical protein FLK61_34105 [Paenalkalicoccus suaedae]